MKKVLIPLILVLLIIIVYQCEAFGGIVNRVVLNEGYEPEMSVLEERHMGPDALIDMAFADKDSGSIYDEFAASAAPARRASPRSTPRGGRAGLR